MQIIILIFLFFLSSCANQIPQNVECMEFFNRPGTEWLTKEKEEEYQEVIEGLLDNDYAINEVNLSESKEELFLQLEELGFSKTNTYLKEKKIIKKNEMGEKIPLLIFNHQDGSVVRVKPMQDMSNRFHPYPHYVLTVRKPNCDEGFECETVKIGRFGYVFPKHPREFKKNISKQNLKCWGDATHIRLNK